MNRKKTIASKVLKCGKQRVWIDPKRLDEVSQAITKHDIRALINDGFIKKVQEKGISNARRLKNLKQKKKGRRQGRGSKKGSKSIDKKLWMKKIRAQRSMLREFKEKGKITNVSYRELYRKAKAGFFKSKNHMKTYMQRNKMFKQED